MKIKKEYKKNTNTCLYDYGYKSNFLFLSKDCLFFHQDFLVAKSNQVSHWIGLNDLAVEGQWRWVDSSSLSDTKAV